VEAHDYPIAHFQQMERLARALTALPAQVLEHHYSGESFGSWFIVLRHKGQVIQLVYDGREGLMSLRRSPDRKAPYTYGPEQSLGAGSELLTLDTAAVQQICRAVSP
jgi:hypothetical protein